MPWWKSRGARGGLLVLLACAIAWMRWHTYAEPRERDPDGEDRLLALRMLVWMAGIFLAVALPGQALVRYFQLWLPWLCVAVALTIAQAAAAIARARNAVANVLLMCSGCFRVCTAQRDASRQAACSICGWHCRRTAPA